MAASRKQLPDASDTDTSMTKARAKKFSRGQVLNGENASTRRRRWIRHHGRSMTLASRQPYGRARLMVWKVQSSDHEYM